MVYIFVLQVCQEDDAGQTMQGCNDCTFDYDGNLWISAPAGKIAPHPYERSMEVDYVQNLYNFIHTDYFIEYDLKVAVELYILFYLIRIYT